MLYIMVNFAVWYVEWLQDRSKDLKGWRSWIQIDYDICRYLVAWFIYQNVICAKTIVARTLYLPSQMLWSALQHCLLNNSPCWLNSRMHRMEYIKETSAIAPFLMTCRMSEIPSSSIVLICCCVKGLFHISTYMKVFMAVIPCIHNVGE